MNHKIRFHTNGYSGVGRALTDIYQQVKYNLFIRVNYSYQVDDGILSSNIGPLYTYYGNIDKVLNSSVAHLIIYRSTLPERLLSKYNLLRKHRKAVWLIDMDIQSVNETVKIFKQSHYKNYWSNDVSIHGSTAIEDPEVYQPAFNYFIQLIQMIE